METINGEVAARLSHYTDLASASSGAYAAGVLAAHNDVVRATTRVDPHFAYDRALPKYLDENGRKARR